MNMFFGFQEEKIKPYLKMANSRIQLTNNKKSAAVKHKKREIATLLGEKKDEKARIKVEHVIREDFLIEAYELLELLCELVFERVKYIASCKECPPDLVEAVSSLIWAATRVEIAEMEQIKKQLIKKFGSKFASDAENNVGNCVNVRLFQKLSVQPPSAFLVVRYMEEIAKEYKVDWVNTDIGLGVPMTAPGIYTDESGNLFLNNRGGEGSALPVPSPSGFSVPMAPGSNLSQAYSHPPQERIQQVMPGSNYIAPPVEKNKMEINNMAKTESSSHTLKGSPNVKPPDGGVTRQLAGKLKQPSDAVLFDGGGGGGGGSDLQPSANGTLSTQAFQRSSSYTQMFSDQDYTYPSDTVAPAPTTPIATPENYDIPPPPYEFAHAVLAPAPKVSAGMDLAARFEALQKKN